LRLCRGAKGKISENGITSRKQVSRDAAFRGCCSPQFCLGPMNRVAGLSRECRGGLEVRSRVPSVARLTRRSGGSRVARVSGKAKQEEPVVNTRAVSAGRRAESWEWCSAEVSWWPRSITIVSGASRAAADTATGGLHPPDLDGRNEPEAKRVVVR
jgi:hypothetical protein